jgi:hypothetical protein
MTGEQVESTSGKRGTAILRLYQLAAIVTMLMCAWYFLISFEQGVPQLFVDLVWVGSLICWVLFALTLHRDPPLTMRIRWPNVWPILLLVAIFFVCWLPFYKNWRWAYTGDSFSFYALGYDLAQRGMRLNALSVHGIDNFYTYLWELTYTWPMYFFGGDFFWLRVGQLLVTCAALTMIYVYFCTVLDRLWASLIVVGTATNYVFIWISYVSYFRTDSFVFTFMTLFLATLIWRNPERMRTWICLGLTSGFALYYTPTVWSTILAVDIVLGIYALATRRFLQPLVAGVLVLLIALPIMTEIPWAVGMFKSQAIPMNAERTSFFPGLEYTWRIFKEIVWAPYYSPLDKLGVSGAFMRWPLGHLYVAGLVVAAFGALPWLRRRVPIPAIAPLLLILLLWDAMFLALTNKGYANASHKRFYCLMASYVFFALLPFYVAYTWVGARRILRALILGAVVLSLMIYASLNLRLIMHPHKAMYGGNIYDGLIQLRQTAPNRQIIVLTTRDFSHSFFPESLFQVAYGIMDNLTLSNQFNPESVDKACAQGALLCYEPNFDRERMDPLAAANQHRLVDYPVNNSFELYCFDCVAAKEGAAESGAAEPTD